MDAVVVPAAPSREEVQAALSLLLDDLLVDFPFPTPADRSHALAAFLLPFMKPMIRGLCPIHLVEAPAIGSGKSLLAKLVHLIASGYSAPITTMGRDEEETRKKITSLLATGTRIIIIDNVVGGISSSNLAAAITSEIWKDRWLGTQEVPELPNNAIWFFTGNNPDISLEIARRCVRIRIESPDERPWLRKDFKHDPIEDWVIENRSQLVRAILVLIQAWVNDGGRLANVAMGSFQPWARAMGGILEFLGVPGFLDNRDEMFEAADARESEWHAFVPVWWGEHGGVPVPTSNLRRLAQQNDMLEACRGTMSEASQTIRLGKDLRSLRGRRFGNLRIVRGRAARNKTNRWALTQVPNVDGGPDAPNPTTDDEHEVGDATVMDLFAPRSERTGGSGATGEAARVVDPSARVVDPPTTRASNPLKSDGARVVAGSAGSDPKEIHSAHTQADTRACASHAHIAQSSPDNYPHYPRLPAEATISTSCDAGGCEDNYPRITPLPAGDDSNVDLADLDQIPEANEEETE